MHDINGLDIDRLHLVIEQGDSLSTRQSGRSFAQMIQVAQSASVIEAHHSSFAVISDHNNMNNYNMRLFIEVADMLGIKLARVSMLDRDITLRHSPSKVMFIPKNNIQNMLRGRKLTNFFIDHAVGTINGEDFAFLKSRLI